MKRLLLATLIIVLCNAYSGWSQPSATAIGLRTWGIKINVTNMAKAMQFYHSILGFTIVRINPDSSSVMIRPATGEENILLQKVSYLLALENNEAAATLTLQVNNLDSAIKTLKGKGLDFGNNQIRKEGVGYAIYLYDPFGTRLSMMQETVVENTRFNEPQIYNYGFYVSNMASSEKFYTEQLGFVIRSQKYLPLDLSLNNPDGSFGFMLHTRNGVKPIHYNSADNQHIVLVFQVTDAGTLIEHLKKQQVALANDTIQELAQGKTVSFYDPFGYISEAIEIKR